MYRFIAIDLEFNQPSGKIIQIGACVGHIETGSVMDKFNVYVDPKEDIRPRIKTLTGINNQMVRRKGIPLMAAYEDLCDYIYSQTHLYKRPLVWGNDDLGMLHRELDQIGPYVKVFNGPALDVQSLYMADRIKQGEIPSGGLVEAAKFYGMGFDGRPHNAVDDAYNTFKVGAHLIQR